MFEKPPPPPSDVIVLDCSRPWMTLMLREICQLGLRPKLMNSATGLGLADWPQARAALFDVGGNWERAVRAIRWLGTYYPHVRSLAVSQHGPKIEWLLREAGACLVVTSVLDSARVRDLIARGLVVDQE